MGKNDKNVKSKSFNSSKIKSLGVTSGEIFSKDGNEFYSQKPSWVFSSCDKEQWILSKETDHNLFWDDVMTTIKSFEASTWKEIFTASNGNHHAIDTDTLNKCAIKRLIDLHIEGDSIISLRLQGTHRLYGYMQGSAFCILWYDTDHGDNDTCVCRSHKKHT